MDRYKEALEKARAEYEKARKQGYTWLMNLLEGMFPDLRESEDERIRKWLIEEIKATHDYDSPTSKKCVDDALTYLEKQKDLDKMIVVSPKVWDKAIADAYENGKKDGEKQEEQTEELSIRLNGLMQEYVKAGKDEEEQEYRLKCYQLFWDALGDSEFFKQKEQKFTEKQDYSDLTDLERAIHRGFLVVGVENVPVTIIKETAQDCLAQMKPAEWSEEDEKHIEALILASDRCIGKWHCCNEQCEISEHLDWLKSLRPPQYCENCKLKRSVENWKPSYEQMEALNEAVGGFRMEDTASCEKTADTLESLYNDLKKLM